MNNIWIIKDAAGTITNPGIVATEEFVQEHFAHYEAYVEEVLYTPEMEARDWRTRELGVTDSLVGVLDHPKHATLMAFRAALREWPATDDFPETKPVWS